ncbi:MAG: hypothetical protein K6G32_07090 [Prevotella sp.]|nr:hypothetical protein [Prevotella sp.]
MKSFDRIPLLANVLTVVCKRPPTEVGKLLKAVVAYVNEGIHTGFDSQYLEAYYDLLILDIDAQRSVAGEKSRKCSENAKCRTAKNHARPTAEPKKAKASPLYDTTEEAGEESDADEADDTVAGKGAVAGPSTEEATASGSSVTTYFNAIDAASSFEQMKLVYGRTGSNASQAYGEWQQLTVAERTAAFAHAHRMQGYSGPRSYLDIYLHDKQWEGEKRYKQAAAIL